MIRVMLVDDDAIIRKGLSQNIPWEDHGFRLVGTAGDGEEGYQLFLETQPDLVISDIKMPFMNGLELARRVLAEVQETKIILLTGYEKFEYAKQALELKIFEYVLKPVDLEELLHTAKRAADTLQAEKKSQRKLRESRLLLQQHFLTRLIQGQLLLEQEVRDEAFFLEIAFTEERFIVMLLKIDDYYNEKVFPGVAEQEVAKAQLINLCRSHLTSGNGEVLNLGGDEMVLIYCSCWKPGETVQYALELGERIRQESNQIYSLSLSIGLGSVHDGLLQIAVSYQEARTAIEFRHIIGKNQVLTVGDTGSPIGEDPTDLPEYGEKLGLNVEMGLKAESLAIIDNIEAKLMERQYIPLSSARLIGMQLAILSLREAQIWREEDLSLKNQLFFARCRQIQEGQTVGEIFTEVRQLITEIMEEINRKREASQTGLVGLAIQYIEKNYQQEGLSLSEVAQAVHVSPVYLSIMFKKERNINFSDFLNEIRMKTAMNFLRNSNLKTYEVAERIGFSNPQYFSVCFKKYTGYSPSEFKKQ